MASDDEIWARMNSDRTVDLTPEQGEKILAAAMRRRAQGTPAAPAPEPAPMPSTPAAPAKKADISALESAGQGLLRWGLLGFDDNLAGVSGALGAGYQNIADDADGSAWDAMKQAYRDARDERRKDVEDAYQANPNAYRAGALGGLLLTAPLAELTANKVAVAAPKEAALAVRAATEAKRAVPVSVVSGVGMGDKDTLGGAAVDGAVGGLLGGALGGLLPAATTGTAKLGEKVVEGLRDAGSRADELRVLTTMGATGGSVNAPRVLREAERVPGGIPEMARVLRESGMSRGITTTGRIAKKSAELQATAGKAIGEMVDEATQAGGTVDTNALAGRLRAEADALVGPGSLRIDDTARQHADTLIRFADRLEEMSPSGVAPIDKVKQLSIGISEDANGAYYAKAAGHDVTGKGYALMDTRRAAEDELGNALEAAGQSRAAYEGAKRTNQVARIANEAAETSLGRANKNNPFSLTATIISAKSLPAGILYDVIKPIMASTRATAAEKARAVAAALGDPKVAAALGAKAQTLQRAAKAGIPQLQAALRALAKDDPDYAALGGIVVDDPDAEARRQALEEMR